MMFSCEIAVTPQIAEFIAKNSPRGPMRTKRGKIFSYTELAQLDFLFPDCPSWHQLNLGDSSGVTLPCKITTKLVVNDTEEYYPVRIKLTEEEVIDVRGGPNQRLFLLTFTARVYRDIATALHQSLRDFPTRTLTFGRDLL